MADNSFLDRIWREIEDLKGRVRELERIVKSDEYVIIPLPSNATKTEMPR